MFQTSKNLAHRKIPPLSSRPQELFYISLLVSYSYNVISFSKCSILSCLALGSSPSISVNHKSSSSSSLPSTVSESRLNRTLTPSLDDDMSSISLHNPAKWNVSAVQYAKPLLDVATLAFSNNLS